MHLSVPTPHRQPIGRLPVVAVLLSVVYAAAIAVALAAPGQHAVAGCAVLAALVSRSVVRRRRSTAGALAASATAVDSIAPAPVPADEPAAA